MTTNEQVIRTMLITTFIFIIILTGGVMNFKAIQHNQGKMPVLMNFYYFSDTHFSYENKSEVNVWYFTDIIKIRNSYFSIGDMLLFTGAFAFIVWSFYLILRYRKYSKDFKQENY